MSISKPKLENPCSKFIEFKGDKGQFFFYDKETEQQIEIPCPIYFIVLDELSTITGYNKKNDCGIYSNEVHSVVSEILRVKTFKGGESIIGKYNDIKDSVKVLGGKFTKSVYALLVSPDKSTELVNFKFKGAAFSAWLDKKIDTSNHVIGVTEFTQEKNGNTIYQVPVFRSFKLSVDLLNEAVKVDEALQEYLTAYKEQLPEKEIAKAEAVDPEPEPIKASDQWQGKSAKQTIAERKASVPVGDPDVSDLPWETTKNEVDDLPY